MNAPSTLDRFWHYKNNKFWQFKSTSSDGYSDTSSEYKYYMSVSNGYFTDNHVSTTSIESSTLPAIYIFTESSGSTATLYVKSGSEESGEETLVKSTSYSDASMSYNSSDGLCHSAKTVDLSSFSSGDTCRIEGKVRVVKNGASQNVQDIATTFTWTGSEYSYTAGVYTIYVTPTKFDVCTQLQYVGDGFYSDTINFYKTTGGSRWVEVVAAYKKVNGIWVEQSDISSVFQSGANYLKGTLS